MSVPPSVYQAPTFISPPSPLHLPPSHFSITNGKLFRDSAELAWLLQGDVIHTVNIKDRDVVARWRTKDCNICCTCELNLAYNHSLLILALETNSEHVLAVINPKASKLVRAVALPHKITSVCSVSANNLDTPGLFSHGVLGHFSGIVAVGCKGGHVYLVDLALSNQDAPTPSLHNPSQMYLIDPQRGVVRTEVSQAMDAGAHICLELTASFYNGPNFIYYSGELKPLKQFPTHSISITALHFAPKICSLAVGYSFGCFQLFALPPLSLIYSSTSPRPLPPVTHLTHLEPENDPRCLFYIWVCRGASPDVEESTGCEVKVALYQLVYEGKTNNGPAGSLYQNFQGCGQRLEYALTPTPSQPNPRASTTSHILQCFTVERHCSGRGLDEDVHDNIDATLVVFIWSCGTPDNREVFIGMFDINRWYHAQMPNLVRWKMSGRYTGVLGCSYVAVFNLTPALNNTTPLLDVIVRDVTPFTARPPHPETFLWPAALSFSVQALTGDGVITSEFLGLQGSALHALLQSRSLGLVEPQRVFQLCEEADLLVGIWEQGTAHTDVNVQRKVLLSVALEHDLTPLLMACAQQWMSGGGASDCDISVMVEWIQQKIEEIASEKDRICLPLFSGSAHFLDTPTLGNLRRLMVRLRVLSRLMTKIEHLQQGAPDPLEGLYCTAMVQCRLLEVIKWCVWKKLLPVTNDVSGDGVFTYPSAALGRCYDMLRDSQNPYKLAVDYLTEELLEGEDYPYPAGAFDDFLTIFTTPNLLAQHCLMIYFLCDIASMNRSNEHYQQLAAEYSRSFYLPYQLEGFARGLWCIDHQNHKDALRYLLGQQPERLQWFPWQHMVVVSSFLHTGQADLALPYLASYGTQMGTMEDAKLKISVLVANRHLLAAFEVVRVYEASEYAAEMFTHLFDSCCQAKCLRHIPGLPINELEEEYFADYLEGHPLLVCQELLVMFLTSRHRHIEALALHEKIRPLAEADPDPKVRERCAYRHSLLMGYTSSIPAVLRQLPTQPEQRRRDTLKTTVDPSKPLSAILAKERVAQDHKALMSEAGLIYTLMEKTEKARSAPADPLTPFRSESSRSSDLKHAPFLSTPLSVRKVRKGPRLVHPTPVHHAPSPSLSSFPDNSALSGFVSHMQTFRERMVSFLSQSGTSAIDTSVIRTPISKTPRSVLRRAPPPHLMATPPSILKVKPTTTNTTTIAEEEEGGEGMDEHPRPEGEEEQPAVPRKIRFAVEGSILPSPDASPCQENLPRMAPRLPTPYAPSQSSSLVTTTLAMNTPLPSDDDSDLFLSPVQSPSQLSPIHPHSITPTSSHPLTPASTSTPTPQQPKLKLFEAMESETSLQPEKPMEDTDYLPFLTTEEDIAQVPPSEEMETSELTTQPSPSPSPSPSPPPPPPPPSSTKKPLPEVSLKLTRQSIGSLFKARTTPASSVFTHSQASPAVSSPLLSASKAPKPANKPSLFEPLLASEIIDAKKKKLVSSIEAAKQRDVSYIRSPLATGQVTATPTPVTKVTPTTTTTVKVSTTTNIPSATMVVPPPVVSEETQFGFSSPTTISPPPPPVASLVEEETQAKNSSPSFVFSPPLTRSAARKQKEKGEKEDVQETTTTRRQTRSSSRRSVYPTTQPSQEPISLITPPTTPFPQPEEKKTTRQRAKPVRTAKGTRRSTRLLGERK